MKPRALRWAHSVDARRVDLHGHPCTRVLYLATTRRAFNVNILRHYRPASPPAAGFFSAAGRTASERNYSSKCPLNLRAISRGRIVPPCAGKADMSRATDTSTRVHVSVIIVVAGRPVAQFQRATVRSPIPTPPIGLGVVALAGGRVEGQQRPFNARHFLLETPAPLRARAHARTQSTLRDGESCDPDDRFLDPHRIRSVSPISSGHARVGAGARDS